MRRTLCAVVSGISFAISLNVYPLYNQQLYTQQKYNIGIVQTKPIEAEGNFDGKGGIEKAIWKGNRIEIEGKTEDGEEFLGISIFSDNPDDYKCDRLYTKTVEKDGVTKDILFKEYNGKTKEYEYKNGGWFVR